MRLGIRTRHCGGWRSLNAWRRPRRSGWPRKAIDLLYDCDNLLQRTRVLTDVRPLFSDDARRVEGAVVAHTLRVRYDHAGRDEEISFSLDAADLRRLIDHCERGLLKEATARRELPERADIPTTPAAEPDDAAD